MYIKRSTLATGAALLLATSGMVFPATVGKAAELVKTPLLPYDLSATASATPADRADPSLQAASETLSQVAESDASAPSMAASADAASVECMAKVVLHEAGNQPRAGKIAVAQTLMNRLKAGRFGGTICEVVNQRGQFFQVSSFHPDRQADGWQDAVEVSHEVLAGETEPVAPGAMFFRASYAPANSFFRTRQRVTTVGAHIFYR
ncbi:cell wall hydrolase [Sphingomonas sp.]|uniref:cell wall hydrolase n=1 Tax=Sphingomonas sp. TaxID=28214 RepID=UPI003B3B0172